MRTSMLHRAVCLSAVVVALGWALPAMGDWDPGDPYKTLFPPDPTGYDVNFTTWAVADDFQCSGSGPITDLHFWYSVMDDLQGVTGPSSIYVAIHAPAPLGQFNTIPGAVLWSRDFGLGDFTTRLYGTGDQGWYQQPDVKSLKNHVNYYQANIINITDPFVQTLGQDYWLELRLTATNGFLGWKTTTTGYAEKSMFFFEDQWTPVDSVWAVNQAFVLTPEPATLSLLALGGLALLRRRRKS